MRLSHFLAGASVAGMSAAGLALPAVAQTAPPPAQAPAPAPTETLREAMVKAYNTNPDLSGERASLRATDEEVPIARSRGSSACSARTSVRCCRHVCHQAKR